MRAWPTGGLWRHADFLKLWSAETISVFGSQVGQLAIPLAAVITLDSTPFEVAALTTILFLPFILFTLPAGVWVDRMRRRPILIAGDLGRFALLATVPIAFAFDALTIWQLYVVGFLYGICTVFFDVAYQSYLPALVGRGQLIEGNSKLEISRAASQMAGPGLGGILVQLLTAPYAVLVDAISFLGSGLFLVAIRKPEPLPEPEDGAAKPSMLRDTRDGLRYVLGNRYLRSIAACTGISNFATSMMLAVFLVYAVRTLDLSPAVIGIVFSISSVGSLAAALAAARISSRFGVGRTTVGSALVFAPALLLIPAAPPKSPIPFLVAAFVLVGFSSVLYNITQVSFRQAITPERMQGRMNSVMRFIVWGVMPVGSLLGGAFATAIGLRETMWIGAVIGSFAFLPVLLSPVRTLREMPEPVSAEPAGDVA
ncbi:MAG: MFS transporter [Thermoleophilia bacterium]|nr:MFS transporter [Thermoleophilia bacterium]MDH4340268.1 MFS transporter [Thermoleophilia bacterium]MDH5281336.1 MFS transporter [Thermoleophilia bacterium]